MKPSKQPNLAKVVAMDIVRFKWVVVMGLLILSSAFAVIVMAHENRQASIELETLLQTKDKLDIEWRHLVLQQGTLAEHSRIEEIAKEKLGMIRPRPDKEVVVQEK